MKGYRERVYKAVEIAGGKVKRDKGVVPVQSAEDINAAMQAWVVATRSGVTPK